MSGCLLYPGDKGYCRYDCYKKPGYLNVYGIIFVVFMMMI